MLESSVCVTCVNNECCFGSYLVVTSSLHHPSFIAVIISHGEVRKDAGETYVCYYIKVSNITAEWIGT